MTRILAKSNLLPRDSDWIRSNGICLEKIRPGQSTIPDAGRGAFAQMFIKAGESFGYQSVINRGIPVPY